MFKWLTNSAPFTNKKREDLTMVQQAKWFERKFNFDFPVGVFPSIVERLRGTPARVEELTRGLAPDILTARPNSGWSIQEHIGHLWDLELLGEQRLKDYLAGARVLTAADLTNRKTHEANHNKNSIGRIQSEFRKTREELVGGLESLDQEQVGGIAVHPRLNVPMRAVDWCYFVAEHDDHHLARITGLMKQRQG